MATVQVLQGYGHEPPRRKRKGRRMAPARRAAMKACAKTNRVATRGFWTCVKKKVGKRKG